MSGDQSYSWSCSKVYRKPGCDSLLLLFGEATEQRWGELKCKKRRSSSSFYDINNVLCAAITGLYFSHAADLRGTSLAPACCTNEGQSSSPNPGAQSPAAYTFIQGSARLLFFFLFRFVFCLVLSFFVSERFVPLVLTNKMIHSTKGYMPHSIDCPQKYFQSYKSCQGKKKQK